MIATPTDESVQGAVRAVLPALGLVPDSFVLPPGFLRRAARSGRPRALTIVDITSQLVFLGCRDGTGEDAAAEALAALPPPARGVCCYVVPVWVTADTTVRAGAFAVTADGTVGPLLGASWIPPSDWLIPQADLSLARDVGLEAAVQRLRDAVHRSDRDDDSVVRAAQVVDMEVRLHGGEPKSSAGVVAGQAAVGSGHRRLHRSGTRADFLHLPQPLPGSVLLVVSRGPDRLRILRCRLR